MISDNILLIGLVGLHDVAGLFNDHVVEQLDGRRVQGSVLPGGEPRVRGAGDCHVQGSLVPVVYDVDPKQPLTSGSGFLLEF